jgi:hypothetical protein
VAIDSNTTVSLSYHGGTIISWSNEVSLSTLFGKTSNFDIYSETLKNRWYSVILFDGALLQFSYTFAGNSLKKHRLSFQPCPILFKPSELGYFTIDELLDIVDGQELRDRIRLEGPLRFDYDLDSGSIDHPASHLTISRTSCRVPVSAPLSVGHFVKFLFSNFYPEQWAKSGKLRNWACSSWDSCLPELEDDRLYVSWKRKA